MRNRALHDALREFALEAAALLGEDLKAGAEVEFELAQESRRRGPALYVYRPLTERFIAERWPRLRAMPSCSRAAGALGASAAPYLRVSGLAGEQAEPALQAMLERLYEDATSFGFPEERFERVYADVETTLYRDTVRATVVAPVRGLRLEGARVELEDGLSLVRGDVADAPAEAAWAPGGAEPAALAVLERDVPSGDPLPAAEAAARFARLVTGLRLFKPGGVALGALAWSRAAEGRWQPAELDGAGGAARGAPWLLRAGEEGELREFLGAFAGSPRGSVAWALARFEMGCSRPHGAEALSDYLLALRALLDALSEAGRASMPLRLAALCAEEGERRSLQRRVELALALERFVMSGGGDARAGDARGDAAYSEAVAPDSPPDLVEEVERHLRALLRDVLCGFLDADLKGVADDILLESPEPLPIEARDLRNAARDRRDTGRDLRDEASPAAEDEPDTAEMEALAPEPRAPDAPAPDPPTPAAPAHERAGPEGVTPSADWLFDEDPESYSAPV